MKNSLHTQNIFCLKVVLLSLGIISIIFPVSFALALSYDTCSIKRSRSYCNPISNNTKLQTHQKLNIILQCKTCRKPSPNQPAKCFSVYSYHVIMQMSLYKTESHQGKPVDKVFRGMFNQITGGKYPCKYKGEGLYRYNSLLPKGSYIVKPYPGSSLRMTPYRFQVIASHTREPAPKKRELTHNESLPEPSKSDAGCVLRDVYNSPEPRKKHDAQSAVDVQPMHEIQPDPKKPTNPDQKPKGPDGWLCEGILKDTHQSKPDKKKIQNPDRIYNDHHGSRPDTTPSDKPTTSPKTGIGCQSFTSTNSIPLSLFAFLGILFFLKKKHNKHP